MKVILVSPRGFCAGVNMAIEALDRAVAMFGTPLYAFHEIVHNRHVVERFRKKGVVFVDDVASVPADAPLMLSAHGTAPSVLAAARARGVDGLERSLDRIFDEPFDVPDAPTAIRLLSGAEPPAPGALGRYLEGQELVRIASQVTKLAARSRAAGAAARVAARQPNRSTGSGWRAS